MGAWVTCEATCNAILTGAAVDGSTTLPMRAVRRTLNGPMRMRMRIKLPARARAGIADDRVIPVRLRLKAAIGTHVVVVRRTIRVGITHP